MKFRLPFMSQTHVNQFKLLLDFGLIETQFSRILDIGPSQYSHMLYRINFPFFWYSPVGRHKSTQEDREL